MVMVVMSVRTLTQEFRTRTYAFYMLTKDETTELGTDALFVPVGSMLLAEPTDLLKIIFLTVVINPESLTFHNKLQLRLYLCQIH
jgi:hypothetical protein